jgi:tRNA modification GTPase
MPRAGLFSRDTIVAIATAPGRGAIAVVRVSGQDAERICRCVVSPSAGWPLRPRVTTRCRIHASGNPATAIDDGLVTLFAAPHSYTGETVIELGVHGGDYVPQAVCSALLAAGARPATAGEFTARAVLNGKLDLLRAEAIADVIDARSRASHRMAQHNLSGALSARLGALREAVLDLEAMLAYDMDFPDEDDGRLPRERVIEACAAVVSQLDALLATAPAAVLGREGATVVLAGPPNAGKSSLLNALVGEARVIVSDAPGTTRDAVEVLLEHDPWPLRLVDTAGLRESANPVELLGIEVSERYLTRAHVVVACAESMMALTDAAAAIRLQTTAPVVGALTKRDLVSDGSDIGSAGFPVVAVSAVRGDGLDLLLARVTEAVAGTLEVTNLDTPMLTRARHQSALSRARRELATFAEAWRAGTLPVPVIATHVHAAGAALDELIGAVDVEDVFAKVFSTFCVGK